jgi:hypothetical protein
VSISRIIIFILYVSNLFKFVIFNLNYNQNIFQIDDNFPKCKRDNQSRDGTLISIGWRVKLDQDSAFHGI